MCIVEKSEKKRKKAKKEKKKEKKKKVRPAGDADRIGAGDAQEIGLTPGRCELRAAWYVSARILRPSSTLYWAAKQPPPSPVADETEKIKISLDTTHSAPTLDGASFSEAE